MSIKEKILKKINDEHISIYAISKNAGINYSTAYYFIRGNRNLGLNAIQKILDYLKIN